MKKRIFAAFLTLLLLFTQQPIIAKADDVGNPIVGTMSMAGFVLGSAATFQANVDDAGDYAVTLQYENATGYDRTVDLYVNGTFVRATTLADMASWDTWGYQTDSVTLNQGSNTITYQYDDANFGPSLCPASDVAGSIATLSNPALGATSMTMPAVPNGCNVSIASTSDASVIATNGDVTPPTQSTTVYLTLQVSTAYSQAETASLPVVVPALSADTTAAAVAAGIKSITAPQANATLLSMPVVPGFAVTIASTSDTSVIDASGKITPPDTAQTVSMTLLVTKKADGSTAQTAPISVVVPAKTNSDIGFKTGAGPLYWTTYESEFDTNDCITQADWEANVNWLVSCGLKNYGYDMVCTDGWLDYANTVNSDGYITLENDQNDANGNPNWTMTLADMGQYLSGKGLKFGMYYDPLWVTSTAYNDNYAIGNTGYHIQDIVNDSTLSSDKNFNCGGTHCYWVDATKPGAKEFLQGYVDYFKSCGVSFLRSDFLCWYEAATNASTYAQALQYISEECAKDGILFSLVMPNQYNDAATELQYGDMMRIDEDCANGGWDNAADAGNGWPQNHVSGRRRGEWQDQWSQWGNPFDGFTYWADMGGRGQMILDGDFIRLNKLATDAQKRSEISLFTMAGSPIAIADRYDDDQSNLKYYENTELLALNKAGFFGKPIHNGDSERWAGQLADGSWVVALFNRDETSKAKSVDFAADLGIEGNASVRNLWTHQDLGSMSSYATTLGPCDCVVLKVTPQNARYQAEYGTLLGTTSSGTHVGPQVNDNHANYSASGFVDKFETQGEKIRVTAQPTGNQAGNYTVSVRYCNGASSAKTAHLYVNGNEVQQMTLPPTGDWDTWGTWTSNSVWLQQGDNDIDVSYDSGDTGFFNVDYVEIGAPGPAPAAKQRWKYEAETATLAGGASTATDHKLYSGNGFVDNFTNSGASVTFNNITAPADGTYDVFLRYANGTGADAACTMAVNGGTPATVTMPTVTQSGAWDCWAEVNTPAQFKAGTSNSIALMWTGGAANLDCITVVPSAGTAQDIADSITALTQPDVGANALTFPNVPSGYNVQIQSSDNPSVITTNGDITPQTTDTTVHLTLSVTKMSDETQAMTTSLSVTVPGVGTSGGSTGGNTGGNTGGSTLPNRTVIGTAGSGGGTSASIQASDADASRYANVVATTGPVTITLPTSVLSALFTGGNASQVLTITQQTTSDSSQQYIQASANNVGVNSITMFDLSATLGSKQIHQLGGSVSVTLKLTPAQIKQLSFGGTPKLYYYDSSTGLLTDMNALFDLTTGTASFTTNHFSTYVVGVQKATGTIPGVSYSAHVQGIGWMKAVTDGAVAGTQHQSRRLEALKLSLTGTLPTGAKIVYQAHVQRKGWMTPVSDGAIAGTVGQSLRIEALRVSIQNMPGYEVKYRAYVQNIGWQNWKTSLNNTTVSSAPIAGTTGKSLRVEAVEVEIVKVGS